VGRTELAIELALALGRRTSIVLLDADDVAPAVGPRLQLPIEPNLRTAIDAVEQPGNLAGGKIRIEQQSGFGGDLRLSAFRVLEFLHGRIANHRLFNLLLLHEHLGGILEFFMFQKALHQLVARIIQLAGGFRLLVGRDLEERRRLFGIVAKAAQWSVLIVVVLGLGGGVFVARRVLRRIDAMTGTTRRIFQAAQASTRHAAMSPPEERRREEHPSGVVRED